MAPTPPLADAPTAASTPSHDERTRRNVACVNCRNSKVRCKSSHVPDQPCQRCDKLQMPCVVDKSHKRVTKRSKLEQLEQELRSIQQVVNIKANGEATWTPPSPRTGLSAASDHPPLSIGLRSTTVPPESMPSHPHPHPHPEPPPAVAASCSAQESHRTDRPPKTGPTAARVLENHVISGEDIDYYFNKFLLHFHPFIPILRKKDPDECHDANPTLFWVVLYVTCRRYAKDGGQLLALLVDHIGKAIWTLPSAPAMGLEDIHALLLVCAWPFPTIRFVTDPSSMLASMAMNACMMLGLHTGAGSHGQFCVGSRKQMTSTDEEASATWLACCTLAQKTSANLGHPPPNIQLNDARCRAALDSPCWADLLAMYDFQKFLNRFYTAAFAQVSATGGVPENTVTLWETELETLKPLIVRYDTEMSRILLLAAQFEIQLFYFMGPRPPSSSSASASASASSASSTSSPDAAAAANLLRLNTFKTFHTARSLITLVSDLESRRSFIAHAPNHIFRTVLDAANTLVYLLHSLWCPPDIPPPDADLLARLAYRTFMAFSVREADLPCRGSVVLETFWSFREYVARFDAVPASWAHRGGAGVTFACLERFKTGLLTAQRSTDGVNKALEILQAHRTEPSAAAASGVGQEQPENSNNNTQSDPVQDVDWTMFMDDFGWVGDNGVLLSLI